MNAPSCDETGGVGPCNIVEHAFVIQWELSTLALDGRPAVPQSFQVILYEKGAIKFQYNNVPYQAIPYAPPSSGIEVGMQPLSFFHLLAHTSAMIPPHNKTPLPVKA